MKSLSLSITIAVLLIGGAFFLTRNSGTSDESSIGATDNVSIVDGTQIVTISARGGYSPKVTSAQADIPTVIKVATTSTFDCSAALVIPSLNYRKNLPPSGETLIEVPPQKAGVVVQGLCAMGMYNFRIRFD